MLILSFDEKQRETLFFNYVAKLVETVFFSRATKAHCLKIITLCRLHLLSLLINKKFSDHTGTVRHAKSVEILLSAAELYKNRILKGLQQPEDPEKPLKVTGNDAN